MKYYHIITQSYRGKNILPEIDDCVAYLQLTAKSFQHYQVLWLAYAVMPTHIHLCVAMPSDDDAENRLVLAKARRKIACGYTAYARKQHPEWFWWEARIFEKRNTLKFLQTPYDVRQLIRYIHLNPLRKELEDTPGETVRSSHQAILALWDSLDPQNPFNCFAELQKVRNAMAAETFFALFGRNRNEQKQRYLALLAQPLTDAQSTQLNAQVNVRTGARVGAPAGAPAGALVGAPAGARTDVCGGTRAGARVGEPGAPDATVDKARDKAAEFQKAEQVLRAYFSQHYNFKRKDFTPETRPAFLRWLNQPANIAHKRAVVTYIAQRTSLSSREIAEVINSSATTVKRMLKGTRK